MSEVVPLKTSEVLRQELFSEAERIGVELRTLIVRCKELDKPQAKLDPYQRPARALGLAQQYLQTGMLWLKKCINQDVSF